MLIVNIFFNFKKFKKIMDINVILESFSNFKISFFFWINYCFFFLFLFNFLKLEEYIWKKM